MAAPVSTSMSNDLPFNSSVTVIGLGFALELLELCHLEMVQSLAQLYVALSTQWVLFPVGVLLLVELELVDLVGFVWFCEVREVREERQTLAKWPFLPHALHTVPK